MNIRLFVIVILALFIQDSIAQPSTYRMGDVIRITQGDTLSNNTILAGQSIEVSGYLDNDLFSASRIFLLNGNITDDALWPARWFQYMGLLVICWLVQGKR